MRTLSLQEIHADCSSYHLQCRTKDKLLGYINAGPEVSSFAIWRTERSTILLMYLIIPLHYYMYLVITEHLAEVRDARTITISERTFGELIPFFQGLQFSISAEILPEIRIRTFPFLRRPPRTPSPSTLSASLVFGPSSKALVRVRFTQQYKYDKSKLYSFVCVP